jgi:hypothetical protein
MSDTILELLKVPAKQVNALKREADRKGVSTQKYVKDVLEEHLARIERIQNSTFEQLGHVYRKGLSGKTEAELDAIVESVRRRRRAGKARRSA